MMSALIPLTLTLLVSTPTDFMQSVLNQDLPAAAARIELDDDGHFREIVVREWVDRVKGKDDAEVYRRFEVGFDYRTGQPFRRGLELESGEIFARESAPELVVGMTREEVLAAFELFAAHPTIQPLLEREGLIIHGGFQFADESECPASERCVHVFASQPPEITVLAHAIVRLRQRDVPYPDYDPPMTEGTAAKKTGDGP